MIETNSTALRRAAYFTLALLHLNLVNDGWNGHLSLIFPFATLHWDLRFGSMAYVVGLALLIFWGALQAK